MENNGSKNDFEVIKTKNIDSIVKNSENLNAHNSQNFNLLSKTAKKGSRKIFKFFIYLILFVIVTLVGVIAVRAANLSSKIFVGKKLSFTQQINSFFKNNENSLQGENQGQVNILLLGIGGEGHEGPYLTDTLILAQLRLKEGQMSLTSIPRDYMIRLPKDNYDEKINAAFALNFAKYKDFNKAGTETTEIVEEISGLKIPYFAVIDFAGFKKAIDEVGGIDITIEKTFTDSEFPDEKFGYLPPITFKAGEKHMDGETALIFSRSRHGTNGEDSDFARSQRQQKVIEAFKQKVFKLNLIRDSFTLNKLLGVFADHFHTNLQPANILKLYNHLKEKQVKSLQVNSLGSQETLICPGRIEETQAWVLVPCPGKTKQDVKDYFKNSFVLGKIKEEKPLVWLANSTNKTVLYEQTEKQLAEVGFTVLQLDYEKNELEQNVVYNLNEKPASLEYIVNTLNAKKTYTPPPGIKADPAKVDIIVILGKQK